MLNIERTSETMSMVSGTNVPGVLYVHGFGEEEFPWIAMEFNSDDGAKAIAKFADREDAEAFVLMKAEHMYH